MLAIAPGRHSDVLLAMITSRPYQAIPDFDETVDTLDPDFAASGLKTPSAIRLSRLVSVEETIINANLGEISSARLSGVIKRLVEWLKQ